MKRITFLSLLFLLMIPVSAYALSWAYPFVVWEGKVYEVKQEDILTDHEIGKVIGEVKTRPNEMTGDYYKAASNAYPIGTKYYEIKGTSTSFEIAVEADNQWVKAVYVHNAPFHIMNLVSNGFYIVVVIIALMLLSVMFYTKKSKSP